MSTIDFNSSISVILPLISKITSFSLLLVLIIASSIFSLTWFKIFIISFILLFTSRHSSTFITSLLLLVYKPKTLFLPCSVILFRYDNSLKHLISLITESSKSVNLLIIFFNLFCLYLFSSSMDIWFRLHPPHIFAYGHISSILIFDFSIYLITFPSLYFLCSFTIFISTISSSKAFSIKVILLFI